LNSVSLDGSKPLHRLLQADSFKGEKVSTREDGLKPSSETRDIAEVHVEDILEGEKSIQDASEISSTGGSKEILRLMHSRSKKAKAVISTRERNQKLLLSSY
jgi:hypothetical protein